MERSLEALKALERRARRRAQRRRLRARRRCAAALLPAVALATIGASVGSASGRDAAVSSASVVMRQRSQLSDLPARGSLAAVRRPLPCPAPRGVRPLLRRVASSTGLPPALLVALVSVESRFDPDAVSPAGAKGLFQLMPRTAAELGIDPSNTAANAIAGARYLRGLLLRFRTLDLALSAYNAGPSAVSRAGGAPTIDVLRYALTIKANATRLAGCTLA